MLRIATTVCVWLAVLGSIANAAQATTAAADEVDPFGFSESEPAWSIDDAPYPFDLAAFGQPTYQGCAVLNDMLYAKLGSDPDFNTLTS